MRGIVVALILVLGSSCHTDPATIGFYGADTVLRPGTESQLTFSSGDRYGTPFHADAVNWAEDGSGISYTFGPRDYQVGEALGLRCIGGATCVKVSLDPQDTCVATLPPGGGSAFWQLCEQGIGHTSFVDQLAAPAVSRTGQLLYVEVSYPANLTASPHSDLWLTDPMQPKERRRLGDGDLTQMQWSGPGRFFAMHGSGVLSGAISDDSTTLRGVPGASGVLSYSFIDGGNSVVTVSGDNLVRKVLVADGSTTIAALPPIQGAHTLDVSCANTVCIALTIGGSPTVWTIWKLDLATGLVTVARTFDHAIKSAKLSPTSGRVVTLEGVNLYLLDLIVQ